MQLRLSSSPTLRVLRNLGYTPGRDARLAYPVELYTPDYPLGTTMASATLVIAPSFGAVPALTKQITAAPSAAGQITSNTGSTGAGSLYFALTPTETRDLAQLGPLAFEIFVVDSRGLEASLDAGSLVPTASTVGRAVDHVAIAPLNPSLPVIGSTQQFTGTPFDDLGNALGDRVVTWSSSDPTVATVDVNTGLATAIAVGNTTITATSEGKTANTVLTVPSALDQLRAAIVGGDPEIAFVYSALSSAYTAAGTDATSIPDATGKTPQLSPDGTGLLVVNPNSSATRYFRAENGRKMKTAVSALLRCTRIKCIVAISSVSVPEGTPGDGLTSVALSPVDGADFANSALLLTGAFSDVTLQGREGRFGVRAHAIGGTAARVAARVKSNKIRLHIISADGVNVTAQDPPVPVWTSPLGAPAALDAQLMLGGFASGTSTENIREVIGLLHVPSVAERAALQLYFERNHRQYTAKLFFGGHSIAWGFGTTSMRDAYGYVIAGRADYANIFDENTAVSGASFSGAFGIQGGDPLEATNFIERKALVKAQLASGKPATRARPIYIFEHGANDGQLISASPTGVDDYMALLWPYVDDVGTIADVVVSTVDKRMGLGGGNAAFETWAVAVNARIVAEAAAHPAVILVWDVRQAGLIDPPDAGGNADWNDNTHPNTAGHLKRANHLDKLLRPILGLPPLDLLLHTFTGADSAVSPGNADTGQVTIQQVGTAGRKGNRLYYAVPDNATFQMTLWDLGVNHYDISLEFTQQDPIIGFSALLLYARATDSTHYFALRWLDGAHFDFLKKDPGGFTGLGTFNWVGANGDSVRLTVDAANNWNCYAKHAADPGWTKLNGAPIVDAFNSAETRVGCGAAGGVAANALMDNIRAVAFP